MSHNYLFTLYALILWLTIQWHNSFKPKHMAMLAIACGLTILSRPSEIVCLLIPLLWGIKDVGSFLNKARQLLKKFRQIMVFCFILVLIGALQFFYWKYFTGKFLYYSYAGNAGEGFEFLKPYTLEVLFSFRKGWLIYTPVMIFSLIGFYALYRKNRPLFVPLLVFFLVNLYIVSSWSCWWYGTSFGQRSLIQSYAIMALPMGYFLQVISGKKKWLLSVTLVVIFLLIALNLFQTWQSIHGIIDGSRMTKAYYFAVFGNTSVSKEDKKLLLINRPADGRENFTNEAEYTRKTLRIMDFEKEQEGLSHIQAYSGSASFQLNEEMLYSPVIEAKYADITDKHHAWIRASVFVYPVANAQSNQTYIVVHFEHKGNAYKYKTYDFENAHLELNRWNKVSFDYLTPEVRRESDKLKVYVWHRGNQPIFVDDLKVEVFERTEQD